MARSFASVDQRRLDPRTMLQTVACAADGAWLAARLSYRLEHWTWYGEPQGTVTAERAWFPDPVVGRGTGGAERAGAQGVGGESAQIAGASMDAGNRLRVFLEVKRQEERKTAFGTPSRTWTVIEVIDAARGTLLATTTVGGGLRPLANGRAYSVIEDASGDRRIQIWEIHFQND